MQIYIFLQIRLVLETGLCSNAIFAMLKILIYFDFLLSELSITTFDWPSLCRYFEEVIHKLLDIAQDSKRIAPADLSRNPVHGRFSAFKEKKIFEVAGEVRCKTILSHPLGRRSLPEDWKRPSVRSHSTFQLTLWTLHTQRTYHGWT